MAKCHKDNKTATKNRPQEVTDAEAGKMFTFWVNNNQNYSKTARQFGRSNTTVRRTATRLNWIERADKINKTIQKYIDNQIAKKEFSNLEVVRAMKNKVAASILERLKDKTYNPTISDYINLLKYEDEFTGGDVPSRGAETVNNTTNNIFLGSITIANNFNDDEKRKLDENLVGYFRRRGAHLSRSQN